MSQKVQTYLVFIVAIFVAGFFMGRISTPGEWYESLIKPPLNPPNYIFGIVWPILYVMIALAGARTWLRDQSGIAMRFWFAQMVLNFSWSVMFFGAEQMAIALAILLAMLAFIVAFIKTSWRDDRKAALLMVPYALWVSFAGYLNLSLLLLN